MVDVKEVKRHIKPKSDSTLLNMRKADLVEYIRCLENNYNVAVSFNENQAKYIESLNISPVVHGRWYWKQEGENHWVLTCSVCERQDGAHEIYKYCPNCGAKMDGDGNDKEEGYGV